MRRVQMTAPEIDVQAVIWVRNWSKIRNLLPDVSLATSFEPRVQVDVKKGL
jgi:hypothetical protein